MKFEGFEHGCGIGGWLTNYKRFNVLPVDKRLDITIGDLEHFDTYITESDVAYLASLSMDHIRLGFDQIVVEETPYVYRERIFDRISAFIGWCEKYGVNVVLNLHKAIGNYCDIPETVQLLDDAELQNRFIALWVEFEKRYADKPSVAFELMNEVRDVDPEKWNTLADRTITALHALNPTRKIIVGSTSWNSPETLKYLRIYEDPNILYTFHTYAPFEFTHQMGVLQSVNCYYNRKMPYPGDIEMYRHFRRTVMGEGEEKIYDDYTVMDKTYIRDYLRDATDFAKAHPDKILWAGEFGTIRHIANEYRENWMRDVISICKESGISYCVWNYLSTPNDGNRFSLVDDDHRRIVSEEMARIIRGEVE